MLSRQSNATIVIGEKEESRRGRLGLLRFSRLPLKDFNHNSQQEQR